MALKNLNFKQLLLEKGEKIGLGVAAGIGLILIVWFGLAAATGSSSPGGNVSELQKLKIQAETAWRNSKPPSDLEKLPPELQAVEVKLVDADEFPTNMAYFATSQGEDLKWRIPKVLGADEFTADVVNGAIQAYYMSFSEKTPKVYTLKTKAAPGQQRMTEQQFKDWRSAFDKKSKKITSTPGTRVMQTPPSPPGQTPIPTAPQIPPGAGATGKGGGRGEMQLGPSGGDGRNIYENELGFEYLDKLKGDERFAQTMLPRRMVIMTGAFPYKLQLEEYRKAMRYGSVEEMLLDPNGARPEFIGFNVQRRKYNPEGKMVDDWTDVDVHADLKRLDMQAVEREPDDQVWQDLGIIVYPNRIVQPLPKLAREQKYPRPKLDSIDKTQEDMLKAMQANVSPAPKYTSRFENDLYDRKAGQESPATATPAAGVGKGVRPPEAAAPTSIAQNSLAIPEKCLVRFVDTDPKITPGYSYEYRIQILMSNPCHEKPERSISNQYSKQEAVEGPWTEVTDGKQLIRVTIPDELIYYVVDEKTDKGSAVANKERAFVQVHRWLMDAKIKPDSSELPVQVGDWAIMERREVRPGEYLGRVEDVEVTTWNPTQERFIIAIHPTELKNRRIRRHNGIPIDFATDPARPDNRPLVVDFEGGEHTHQIGGRPVKDVGPVEMLIMTSDNRLVVRNSRHDTDNQARQERVATWKKWLDQIRSQGDEKPGDKSNPLFPTTPSGGKPGSG